RTLFCAQETCGTNTQAGRVGEAKVLVETPLERCRQMCMAVDETRKDGFAASVVDVGIGVFLEDVVVGADRRDLVAFDGKCDIIPNVVHLYDRRVRKDNCPARCLLRLSQASIEKQGGGASARSNE